MKSIKEYYNNELSEQLGLDCFSLEILKSLKSIFFTKQPIMKKVMIFYIINY